jgi:hypothetical protein
MKPSRPALLQAVVFVPFFLLNACGGGGGNGGGGGGGDQQNPAPSITSVSPTSAPQSGSSFTLTVNGSGFVSSSQVYWGQTALTTSYVSATSVTSMVPGSDLGTMGTVKLTVVNPTPGGGTSNAIGFTVGNPVPLLSSIQPSSAPAGSTNVALSVGGSNFLPNSQVEWNGTALPTTYESPTSVSAQIPASDLTGAAADVTAIVTVVNPSPDGGASSGLNFKILAALTYVRTIDLAVNDIVWDGTHGRLYASLPSSDTNGDSVVAIDPVAGTEGTPQPTGKEPDVLGLSDDDSFLYAGLDGTGSIVRFSLPNLTPDSSFNVQLADDPRFGQMNAITLAVVPGKPHSFAVRIGLFGDSPSNLGGIAVFDDATERPKALAYPFTRQDVQWGQDATVLFGSSDSTAGDFTVMSVDSNGITVDSDTPDLGPNFGNIHYDQGSGLAYLDGGWVIDPAHDNVAGAINLDPLISYFNPYESYGSLSPLCALDPQQGVIFYLGKTALQFQAGSGVTIEAFDANTKRLLATLPISGPTGKLGRFVRWGAAGLAFVMAPNQNANPGGGPIYLVDGSFVSASAVPDSTEGTATYALPGIASISPQSAVIGSQAFTLTVTGSNFYPSSQIVWRPGVLPTTFVSSTELQAQITPGNLMNAGNVAISVADSVSALQSIGSLAFTVLPAANGTNVIPVNLASMNLAWDSKSQQLILPVWSADPQYPNTVVTVNPSTGAVVHVAPVQTDPSAFSGTEDGSYVYTGYTAANAITQLSMPGLDASMSWALPLDPEWGPLWAYDLQTAPGASQTVAVDFGITDLSAAGAGNVTIYDDGVARPQTAQGVGEKLEWGASDEQLYGVRGSANFWALDTFNADTSGLTIMAQDQALSGTSALGDGTRVHFDSTTGYLYQDNGYVFDPATNSTVGHYNDSGFVAVDAAMNRVFILSNGGGGQGPPGIQAFNKTTFSWVDTLQLPDIVGSPVAFIRWGANGLAFVTYNPSASLFGTGSGGTGTGPAGMLYIISDSKFVSGDERRGTGFAGSRPVRSLEQKALAPAPR